MRENRPLPKRIQNAPQLNFSNSLFYEAFWDLSSSRPFGLSEGLIPWFSIRQYAILNEYDEDQTEDLHYFIPVLDMEYLQFMESKRKKK